MGMHTIQQARIDHPETLIIAIASPQHHVKLQGFGADKVFDYNSASLVKDIRKLGRDVRRGIDCHSEGRSTVLAAECMLSNEKPESCAPDNRRRLIRTLPPGMISGTVPASVRADEWILSYTALGKVHFPFSFNSKSRYSKANPSTSPSGFFSNTIPQPRQTTPTPQPTSRT